MEKSELAMVMGWHPPLSVHQLGASDFKEAMAGFHDDKVSFVSVHGITTAMVLGIKAQLLLCKVGQLIPATRSNHTALVWSRRRGDAAGPFSGASDH